MLARRNIRPLVLILALLLTLGLANQLPRLASFFLADLLKSAGFDHVSLTVLDAGWTHLDLSEVALDKALSAKSLKLRFNPLGLSGLEATNLTLNAATDWKSLRLGPLTIPLAASGASSGGFTLPKLGLDRARVNLETPIGKLKGQLESESEGNATRFRLDLSSDDHPALVSPLILTGLLSDGAEKLRFAGKLNDPMHRLMVKFQGWQDKENASGALTVNAERLDFSAQGFQPKTFFPFLEKHLDQVAGPLEGKASFSWQNGQLSSEAQIAAHGLSFESNGLSVRNLMGVLSLDRVWPPRTPGLQSMSVGLLSVGVPLGSGSFSFALTDDGGVYVKRAALNLADGKLRLDPVNIAPGFKGTLNFQAQGVDLAKLAPLFQIQGMTLGGAVDGTIPVILDSSGVKVAQAQLAAREKGFVRYRPQATPPALQDGGEAVSLMMAALRDFQYDSLALELDGQAGGETTVAFHIKGRNPGLSDGAPFEFNFRLTGPLDRLARQAYGVVSPPDMIEAALADTKR